MRGAEPGGGGRRPIREGEGRRTSREREGVAAGRAGMGLARILSPERVVKNYSKLTIFETLFSERSRVGQLVFLIVINPYKVLIIRPFFITRFTNFYYLFISEQS